MRGLFNQIFLFDRSRPAGERMLFVDVTETRRLHQHSGVPRVTRSVLEELRVMDLPYKLEEVFSKPHHAGFYSASTGKPIRVALGDVFLGLDLSKFLTQKNRLFLDRMYRGGIPVYFYVHDLIPIKHPENCTKSVVRAFPKWLATVCRYNGLIANSRSTRDEFAEYLSRRGCRAANERILIDFSYPGATFPARRLPGQVRPRPVHEDGRLSFISVGAMEKRKGYGQLLGAFCQLWDKGLDITLTIVGPTYRGKGDLEDAIRSSPYYGKSLFWHEGYVSDEDLASLYELSDAYISASFAEGFGLPVTEAASFGVPLILRDIPVYRELGGEGAFYFSGESDGSLAEALEEWIALYKEDTAPYPRIQWRGWRECAEDICRIILPEFRAKDAALVEKKPCDVSVIIVNYNTRALLRGCLASLYDKTEGLDFEVIVSDNGSTDGSAEMVRREFPQVVLVENMANLGFGAANNRALDRAGGKYVFYLNSDTLLQNNAVKIFYDYWESHPEENLGALGCNLTWPDG